MVLALVAVTTWRGLPEFARPPAAGGGCWRCRGSRRWCGWSRSPSSTDRTGWAGSSTTARSTCRAREPSTTSGPCCASYVARIPLDVPDNWPVHLAGHPPGAVLMFIGLDRVGLGSWQAAGWSSCSSRPRCLRRADHARPARCSATPRGRHCPSSSSARPPSSWQCRRMPSSPRPAPGRRRPSPRRPRHDGALARVRAGHCVAGLLFGWCLMESYGLVLLGAVALAVLFAATGSGRARGSVAVVAAATAGMVVVAAFAALGFAWWEAYPVLQRALLGRHGQPAARAGTGWRATLRPWCWCAGPMLPAALAAGCTAPERRVAAPARGPSRWLRSWRPG